MTSPCATISFRRYNEEWQFRHNKTIPGVSYHADWKEGKRIIHQKRMTELMKLLFGCNLLTVKLRNNNAHCLSHLVDMITHEYFLSVGTQQPQYVIDICYRAERTLKYTDGL